ncbi:phosphotransferase enzyme family protein, partial [Colletotrichum tofieldiae]
LTNLLVAMSVQDIPDRILREVRVELANTPYRFEGGSLLSGGTANFIYHVNLSQPLPDGTTEVAVKHGEDFLAQNPDFKLPTSRCRIEESCLEYLSALPPSAGNNLSVATPKLFYFNEETNTQVQEYQPSPLSLKNYALQYFAASVSELVRSQSLNIGQSMGKWLRAFHDWSNSPEQRKFRDIAAANKEMQKLKHWVNYERLPSSVERFPSILGDCASTFTAIADKMTEEMQHDENLKVIHGDFWTGNILLKGRPWENEHNRLLVVDWEMCMLAVTPLDLGQMIAELYELKLYKDMDAGLWLIQGFVEGYGVVDDEFAFRTLLHVGVHLIGFGTTVKDWGTEEQIKDVASEGRDLVMNASCYEQHIAQKVIKRLAQPYKDIKERIATTPDAKAKYLLGLSFGPSSASLVQVLDKNLQGLKDKNLRVAYEVHVVHIDTDLSGAASTSSTETSAASRVLEKYRERFPNISMQTVPLSDALALDTIDWTVLPALQTDLAPALQVKGLLEALPSVTSRVDIMRLLVRHLLLSLALKSGCHALMLGCTTTALAELTLAETAKGRGFAVPWQVGDGPVPVTTFSRQGAEGEVAEAKEKATISVYYLLRDVFRREIITYAGLIKPPMKDLIQDAGPSSSTIVSHKELSIEDVMARYFEEVEESYPSVVANVVRTSAKLTRENDGDACAVCGMDLDEQGEARWKGEIGDDPDDNKRRKQTAGRLCYGCERSIYG